MWEISNIGKARIVREGDIFKIEIPIDIMYRNRDERYKTQIQFHRVVILMSHLGQGKERSPFKLDSVRQPDNVNLKPMETNAVSYACTIKTPAKPLLGEMTKCRVAVFGEAWIFTLHITMMGKLKRKGSDTVRVPIIWDKEYEE